MAGFENSGEGWNDEYPFGQVGGARGEENVKELERQFELWAKKRGFAE
jgi:hypothetical protein